MIKAFSKGIEFLKKEGAYKFIVRIVKWIPEYIAWRKLYLQGWLCEHVDKYRWKWKYRQLRKSGKVDSFALFKTVSSGLEYCRKNNQPYEILNKDEKLEVVFPECFEERTEIQKKYFDSPPIYLTTFMDVDIYGATNLITKGKIALSDAYAMNREENRYDIEGGCLASCHKEGKWIGIIYQSTDEIISRAINCVGGACENYYHFTFEILSRLAFADQIEEYRLLPVLVDAAALAVPQMRDLFDRVNVWHHPVIPVKEYVRIHVKQLVFASQNVWMPLNYRRGMITKEKDYLFSRTVVDNIRDRVLRGQQQTKGTYRKIYLSRRNCSNRRLVNDDEIEKIFVDHGYHIVFPERLSFDEEVAVFYGADIIVGVTGAAFTNMIFCHEGAKVGMILHKDDDVYDFSNIANMIDIEFIMLWGEIATRQKYVSMDTFVLDADKCRRFIEFIENKARCAKETAAYE